MLVLAGLVVVGATWTAGPAAVPAVEEPPVTRMTHAEWTPSATSTTAVEPPAQATADRLRGPQMTSSPPALLGIPRLGLLTRVGRLHLAADGTMQAPAEPEDVGWFTGSGAPGAVGPAVLAGHVTWNGSPAVFHELAGLRRDDKVLIRRKDGRTGVFAVTDVRRFPKAAFPTRAVYGATDHAALRLITCGGRFDADSRRYADNVVVFARLVDVRERAGRS